DDPANVENEQLLKESQPSLSRPIIEQIQKEPHPEKSVNNKETDEQSRVPTLYPIGQLQGTYILAQNDEAFYMIDQHAAQERIKYEFYKKQLGTPNDDRQQLLFPLTFEFTTDEQILIENNLQEFERIGLFLEPFGHKTYAVREYPSWFPHGQEDEIVKDIVEQVLQHKQINIEKLREEIAILMACKKSIKANHYLSTNEMEQLLNDLSKTNDPFTCPHGRPVIIQFTYYEIEKMFKRIM